MESFYIKSALSMDTKYAEESKQIVSDQTAPLITFQAYTLCPTLLSYLDNFPDTKVASWSL